MISVASVGTQSIKFFIESLYFKTKRQSLADSDLLVFPIKFFVLAKKKLEEEGRKMIKECLLW